MLVAVLASVTAAFGTTSTAMACSPPFDPTIRALGPQQVVVVGTIGERVPDGRLFYVQRAYNGPIVATPIVIAFKEGEPIGDCSYRVAAGQALIIAPERGVDGHLSANLATLQAPPDSDLGRTYIAEAIELFGPGVVPPPAAAIPTNAPTETPIVGAAFLASWIARRATSRVSGVSGRIPSWTWSTPASRHAPTPPGTAPASRRTA